ncbi:hypothetical protein ACI2IX_20125 [Leifsonia aquatica]|uniref:hypothetical protein n=1 Tax=Leifsonia aquatica TaxID=144185 RepID=UPI00384A70DD
MDDPLDELRALRSEQLSFPRRRGEAIDRARLAGVKWAPIAEVLGMRSVHGAKKAHEQRHDSTNPDE